jgi:predicted aspartyl protease
MVLRALAATCLTVVLLGAARPLAVAPYATLGFEYVHHEIVIRATVDGAGPYAFLLDTGTNLSVVDTAVARKLGIKPGRTDSASFAGTLHGLSFGTMAIGPLDIVVKSLSARSRDLGIPLAGVLGANFFDGRSIRVDYPCREAAIVSSHTDASYTATFKAMQAGWIDIADAWANGRRVRATIDTGNSGTPIVTKRGIERLHLQNGRLQDLRIGAVAFAAGVVRLSPTSNDAFDLSIGNRTLEGYIVTFDYLRGMLTLVKSAHKC